MNRRRRDALRQSSAELRRIAMSIESIKDDEEYCMDNIPENLQGSYRYSAMEQNVDHLSNAVEDINFALEEIDVSME